MVRTGTTIALAALLLIPAVAEAQDTSVVRIYTPDSREAVLTALMNRRVRLGVNVDLQASETDTIGARIEGVTPGGPADRAGLKAGDVITRLDGAELYSKSTAARRERQSVPGMRLIELAAKLEPKDTVSVEYLRDGRRHTTSLVTADEPAGFAYRTGPSRVAVERMMENPSFFRGSPNAYWTFGSPLGRLELAPVNDDLGRYFGVTGGILVIDAPEDSQLKLRGGDVVLSVDGREPNSPQHLLRILRSYEPGEEIRLEIQRDRRRETVTATIEEGAVRTRSQRPADDD